MSTSAQKDPRYQKLLDAAFDDPFSYLGPQYRKKPSADSVALRVWMPEAEKVYLVRDGEQDVALSKIDYGLFEWCSETSLEKNNYKLRVEWDEAEQVIHDPYQFHGVQPDYGKLIRPSVQHREMGAQRVTLSRVGKAVEGTRLVVFAPHAASVSVIGDFNRWDGRRHPMQRIDDGNWGLFIPELNVGEKYKFELKNSNGDVLPHKADPWGQWADQFPSFASIVYDRAAYQWQDQAWQSRDNQPKHELPLSFYELHIGSWRRDENGEPLNYRDLADQLVPYLTDMGYTHVELMPVSEHPFYGSWGYQPIGLFAPTSRFGTPDDFKYFVDRCHQENIGVVLDWVPAHFPSDSHGLANFDGTALYNDPDPRRGWHQDWNSYIYDYGRDHVRHFLVSNALYWLDEFHIDGLRVDAVASMLYLDYSREHGEWLPNHDGGNENYDAISLLRWMNEEVYRYFPNAMTIAEESTAFNGVSRPTSMGGLGFGFKWNMGWMHDSLSYIQQEPIHRQYHHNTITFPLIYAFSENYVLSLSHDEVVYGKGALHDKMPGDEWQKTANLRAYLGYMYGQPGKKLNFMGTEIAQTAEWNHDGQLEWHWLDYPRHQGVQALVRDLNHMYCATPALYQLDTSPQGFEWRIQDDAAHSILVHERFDRDGGRVMVVSNFTPVPRENYRVGVPVAGRYTLILNTDDPKYWGGGAAARQELLIQPNQSHGLAQSVDIDLPPLSTLFYRFEVDT